MAVGGACLLALTVIPPFLAERYVDSAYAGWRDDLDQAEADLNRAASLNPLAIEPLMARGVILLADGKDELASEAFSDAASERPEEWATHYFLALLELPDNPRAAREELEIARKLNPLSYDLVQLEQRIERASD